MTFESWILKSHRIIPSKCALLNFQIEYYVSFSCGVDIIGKQYTSSWIVFIWGHRRSGYKVAHFEVPVSELGNLERRDTIHK